MPPAGADAHRADPGHPRVPHRAARRRARRSWARPSAASPATVTVRAGRREARSRRARPAQRVGRCRPRSPSPARATSRPAWSAVAPARPAARASRPPRAPPPAPTSGSPASARAPSTPPSWSWSTPTPGPALADVTVLGPTGPLDVPRLRGVAVPGRSSVRLDLASVAPRRGELTLRVATSRGRLSATVLDSVDELGAGRRSQDWLAAQSAPSTDNLLLGLPAGAGTRTLLVANPGDDEVRVQLKVVSDEVDVRARGRRADPGRAREHRAGLGGGAGRGRAARRRARPRAHLQRPRHRLPAHLGRRRPRRDRRLDAVRGRDRRGPARRPPPGCCWPGPTTEGTATVTGWTGGGRRVLRTRVEVRPDRGTAVRLPAVGAPVERRPATRTPLRAGVLVDRRRRHGPPAHRRWSATAWCPRSAPASAEPLDRDRSAGQSSPGS